MKKIDFILLAYILVIFAYTVKTLEAAEGPLDGGCDANVLQELSEGFYNPERDGGLVIDYLNTTSTIEWARAATGCASFGYGQLTVVDTKGSPYVLDPGDNNEMAPEYMWGLMTEAMETTSPMYSTAVEFLALQIEMNDYTANKVLESIADVLLVRDGAPVWDRTLALQLIEIKAREYVLQLLLKPVGDYVLERYLEGMCQVNQVWIALCNELTYVNDLRWEKLDDGTFLWTRDYYTATIRDLTLRARASRDRETYGK